MTWFHFKEQNQTVQSMLREEIVKLRKERDAAYKHIEFLQSRIRSTGLNLAVLIEELDHHGKQVK